MRAVRICTCSSTRRRCIRRAFPGSAALRTSPSAGPSRRRRATRRLPIRRARERALSLPSSPTSRTAHRVTLSSSPGRGMTKPLNSAEGVSMRLGTLLPRAVLIALAWILATAAFTLAADKTNIIGQRPTPPATGPAAPPNLVVPDVSGQAFVFAKGLLEDAGFAWHVTGSVHGYAGNQVVGQSPAAGTQVVDTGAPTVVVTLVKGRYGEQGVPQDTSSYHGTAIELADRPAAPAAKLAAKAKPSAAKAKPAVRKPARKPVAPVKRPPAFHVRDARKEPLDEISLPARAEKLAAWIATKPKRNGANVHFWLYQHAWIVTGANFGWWHGAQALETLIAVDQRVERLWGIGSRSESVARAALTRVRREAR